MPNQGLSIESVSTSNNSTGTEPHQNNESKQNRTGRWILAGLLLGILCGVFFGEYCAALQIPGQAYVGLLQMTVLPYLVISLIAKMGRLQLDQARRLGLTALVVLLSLWVIGILLIVLVTAVLPPMQGASFYSSAPQTVAGSWQDVLPRFIPTNVFRSLSDEYVPAVVVFCLFFGSALMLLPGKEPLLDFLDLCSKGLGQINQFLVRLAPIGLFALTAAAAGTLRLDEMSRLQAYLIMFTLACTLAAFGILPALVSSLTPIRYRDFVAAAQEPVLIAIATGKLFVTLPQITEKCEQLLRVDESSESTAEESTASVLVPLAYPFPHLGKILAFVFITFAAWYAGKGLTTVETANMAATGTISSFASPLVTMPYLLDEYRLPQDLLSLFILPGFITMRLADVVGVVHLMALTVIVDQFLRGRLQFQWKSLIMAVIGLSVCLTVAIGASRRYLASTTLKYDLDKQLLALQLPSAHDDVIVYRERDQVPERTAWNGSTLDRIKAEKVIRIGYFPDRKPYCFINSQQELVGLDVELLHGLAKRMELQLQFVPYTPATVEEQLAAGEFDVVIGGVIMMPERLVRVGFTQPYQTATLSVVARDFQRGKFDTWEHLRETSDLRLGATHIDMATAARRYLPDATVEVVESVRPYFASDRQDLDGLIMAAEIGSVWSILHPDHSVVVPQPVVQRPVSMVVRAEDRELLQFLDRWLDFERLDGSLDRLRVYWIEGGATKEKPPRWCVLRDVMGWLP